MLVYLQQRRRMSVFAVPTHPLIRTKHTLDLLDDARCPPRRFSPISPNHSPFPHLLLRYWLILASQHISLRLNTLLSPLTGRLGLGTFSVHLFLERSLTRGFGFGFVDLDGEKNVDQHPLKGLCENGDMDWEGASLRVRPGRACA
jgi:hypothetical protein